MQSEIWKVPRLASTEVQALGGDKFKILNIMEKGTLIFRVDTVGLLQEICDCGLDRNMGVLKVPLNIFRSLLWQVANRAGELNDPELNILMLRLGLYEVEHKEIEKAIEYQEKRINKSL